jgi:hypothetical protein
MASKRLATLGHFFSFYRMFACERKIFKDGSQMVDVRIAVPDKKHFARLRPISTTCVTLGHVSGFA